MMMKSKINYKIGLIVLVSILFIQCTDSTFLIAKNRVGKLSNKNTVADIDKLFANDSIVKHISEGAMGGEDTKYMQDEDEYLIYSKQGKHLFTIVPKVQHDSTSTIKYVEIKDSQFKTTKDISLLSPFKDIHSKYTISKIETSLSSAILYIDELNTTISMSKKAIGVNPFDRNKIVLDQIPDMTKIDHFTVWFD